MARGISSKGVWLVAAMLSLALAALWLPAAASAADGAISGEVTRSPGGAPVEKAIVCAETEENEVFEFECDQTAADGTYEITGLPPADYFVFFGAGESGQWVIHQYYDGASGWADADAVSVASGATTPGIDAALVEGGAISGRVTDAVTNAPIGEVEVCSWSEADESFDGCDYTASDGTYEIVGVPPGMHGLEFWAFEGDYEPKLLSGVSVLVGAKTANVNASMVHEAPEPPPIEGRVSGHVYAAASHAPLGAIDVCAIWAPTGDLGGCTLTSKAGAYGFIFVGGGPWKIAFSPDPTEFEAFEPGEIKADAWPTQFWNLKPTLAQADVINVTANSSLTNVDALLGPGPTPPASQSAGGSPTPTVVPPTVVPKPKPVRCKKGFVKKRVKGRTRCVKRHRHHGHKRHHRHR